MSFSLRSLPTLLVVCFGLTVPLFAQSSAQTNKVPRAAITGRITIKDKGAGGVVVGARRTSRNSPLNNEPFSKAITDQDGNYRISNLAAGSYEVILSAPAFVVGSTNNVRTKRVIVNDDETIDGINFSLIRGGVITGRVTDGDGRPVIQQGVQLYRVETEATAQQVTPRPLSTSNATATDDRGIYRLYGLVPGRYTIAAGKGDEAGPPAPPGRFVYTKVFYPDTTDNTKATIIEVTEGSETKDIDINLGHSLQTFSASGRVVDEKNVPVPNLRFGLQRGAGQRTEFLSTLVVSNSQGDFIVEGLIPGKYGIFLFPDQAAELRVQSESFDIVDQDVSGITISLAKGGSLSGVVVLESEDKTAFNQLSKLQLRAFVSKGGGFAGVSSSPISPDGGFRMSGLSAGTLNMMLTSIGGPMPPAGFYISRMERDGVAVPSSGIEIKEGEHLTNLRVILVYGTATLRGQVKLDNGKLPEGGQIVVRLSKIGETDSFSRPAQADARGNFVIENLASGVYELSAQVHVPTGPPRGTKKVVNVQEGVTNEILVTIDMSAPAPQP
jgi:protocatechuate 3,4-dioxygenase beta subunit